jgi:hypothetical protein
MRRADLAFADRPAILSLRADTVDLRKFGSHCSQPSASGDPVLVTTALTANPKPLDDSQQAGAPNGLPGQARQ